MDAIDPDQATATESDEAAGAAPVTKAAATQAELAVAPELVANTLGEYARGWLARLKSGESGMLPVVVGLVAISIYFQARDSHFLTAGNLTNLLVQGAVFMVLGMAEVYALLLGEIDLSIGFVAGMGGVVAAELVIEPRNLVGFLGRNPWPWWAAVIVALLVTGAIGLLHGTLITRLRLPSFIVTLAGLLGWQGMMIHILGKGGTVPIQNNVLNDFANANLTVGWGWILGLLAVAGYAALTIWRDARRRASGLVAPPTSLTALRIAAVAAAAIALLIICNINRGSISAIRGVPWIVPIVLAVLGAWSFLLAKTKFGRYIYAIGGNAEAARRAGINLAWMRTIAFGLAGFTAGIAGILYASRLRSVSTSLDGGTLVLYAVASAVIGGTSLFGGRGKPVHAVLGGLVIAAIYNGMGLLGMSAAAQYMVTALVLLAAVIVDAVARRGRGVAVR